MNFKTINIGELIKTKVAESGVELSRICNFLKCSEEEVPKMYDSVSLDTEILLRWSKLLEYDFFRIYSQHLVLYSPPSATYKKTKGFLRSSERKKTQLPDFRKNIYTKELIEFILEIIDTGEKTKKQVIEEYKIPKATLYKWISKYGS